MKISLKWLNDYVDVRDYMARPEELAELLTAAGLEVEHIDNLAGRFQHVVVGQVVELGRHPDADRLTLCQVDTGEGQPRQIVCGAKNHKQGDKVVVALPGAVLPKDFVIKKSKIRGVESFGMMCSEVELGLADESAGIMILPGDAPVGKPFSEYSGLDDVVVELSVTPNRADCLSHVGLAREVSCLTGKELKAPAPKLTKTGGSTKFVIDVELKASDLCPRYGGRLVRNVKIGPSPAWLKQRLEAVDVNSINNVVDITNFVMLELGQPLHAFDTSTLEGGKIVIDRSKANEKFKTLDGTEISLTGEELMIRDGKKPVALAGVVGGLNSGVSESTTEIFIESAHFTPETVRKTSRKFGIETDSAYRFARGTDPEGVITAMNRACELIAELAGGEVADDFHDVYPKPQSKPEIRISLNYLEQRLGYSVPASEFESWMQRLGCQVKNAGSDEFTVSVPPYRWDLSIKEDLVEEYARLNGYDKIPETLPPLESAPTYHDEVYEREKTLISAMAAEGYLQAVNYNFTSGKFQKDLIHGSEKLKSTEAALGVELNLDPVDLVNPLSEDLNQMRVSLLPSLLKNVLHNYRHGNHYGRMFEIGFAFGKQDSGFREDHRLALIGWGQKETLWEKSLERPVVFDVKAAVGNLLAKLRGVSYQWRKVGENEVPAFLHPGQVATLFYEGRVIGYVGSLHPALRQQYKLRHDCAVCEIDIPKLMRGQPRLPKLKSLSKFPFVERDLAFVVPKDLEAGEIVRQITKFAGPWLQSVEVFDLYEGKNLPVNHRSIAFRLVYQESSATLSEEQLTTAQQKLITSITKHFSIEVR